MMSNPNDGDAGSVHRDPDPSHELESPALEQADSGPSRKDRPYSIFTSGEKWAIVVIASIAGLFR
jgi:hypothetical protein